jgi:hypothetical protein
MLYRCCLSFCLFQSFCLCNSSKTFLEILMKLGSKKDHNVKMNMLQRECCSHPIFKGVIALRLRFFFYVFTATPKALQEY